MTTRSATLLLLALPALGASPEVGSAQVTADTGTFTLVQGDAAIATEAFVRTGARLETTLEISNQATLVTRSALLADATIARMEIEVYGPGGPVGDPIETSAASFEDGAVTLEQPIGTELPGGPQPAEPGAIPYVNPSPSYMEQIIRRARAIGGDEARVSLWMPGQPEGPDAVVSFDADTATIDMGGIVMRATTDAEGRLLGATIPAQGVTIIRE